MKAELTNKIIKEYETPTYVFDIKTLKKRIEYLKKSLPSSIQLCYAIKANTFVAKDIENDVDRFEVCSNGEYEICRKVQLNEEKILISGINKDEKWINNILKNSKIKLFSIESMEQYKLLKSINEKIKIIIRVTNGNQFGINEEELKRIIEENKNTPNIEIEGIQYFTGTQKNSIKKFKNELEYMDNLIQEIEENYSLKIKELEFGTGFPVYYFKNEEFNEEEFFKEFSECLNSMKFDGKIILEIGRSMVASCGYYFTKVVDKKVNKNEKYAIVDGGINHIVYYGQFMAMKIPDIELYPQREFSKAEEWNICGSLCTINDILVKKFEIPNLQIGDVLIFKNAGAYCMTEGISLFLSRDLPQVLKIDENDDIKIVRKITPIYQYNIDYLQ